MVLTLSFSALAETTGNELSSESMTTERFASSYEESKTISNGLYIGGGVASIIPGFGIGHALQGRYWEKGWVFTVGNLVFIGGYVTFAFVLAEDLQTAALKGDNLKVMSGGKKFVGLSLAFLLGILGFKVWEIVDAWNLPSHYKVVKESPFQIKPLAFYNQDKLNLGLSLNYNF